MVEVAERRRVGVVGVRRLSGPVLLDDRAQVARLPAAGRGRLGAAGVERAAQRRVGGVGDLAARQVAGDHPLGVGIGDRLQQRLRVGVARVAEDLLGGADLHDPPEVHDRDPVAEELRRRQVVGDVDVGEPELVLQVEHQLEDLRAHAHVEHRDRLVGHQHLGLEDDGARDHGPLLLPAGEVGGVLRQVGLGRGEPHALEGLRHPLAQLGTLRHAVDLERVPHPLLDRHRRVERRAGVLEDHLQVGAQLAQLLGGHRGDLEVAPAAVVGDRPLRRRHQPEQGPPERGLAAAGLADQAEHLAAVQGEVDAVDGLDPARLHPEQARQRSALQLEVDGEVLEVEHGLPRGRAPPRLVRLRRQRRAPSAPVVRTPWGPGSPGRR